MMNRPGLILAALVAAALVGGGCADAAGAPYELQFIDTMTAHHEAGVKLAKIAQAKAFHPETRDFATRVVETDSREMDMLRSWRQRWFANRPKAVNLRLAGMAAAIKGMDAGRLNKLDNEEFDLAFLEMMLLHHQAALTLAQDAASRLEHDDVKELARRITLDQPVEIEQMRRWTGEWQLPK
jgi:uncharacterized protein (DUF305 family)